MYEIVFGYVRQLLNAIVEFFSLFKGKKNDTDIETPDPQQSPFVMLDD